jgi:hypothetical protein
MRRNILVDIDHVLSNAFWRDGMIGQVPWDEYHAANKDDKPIDDMVWIVNTLAVDFNIVAFTARPAKWRKQTMDWLIKNDVMVHEVLMRPDDNFRPAPELKLELVKARFENPAAAVAAILDDRLDVCSAFAQMGITSLQVFARSK